MDLNQDSSALHHYSAFRNHQNKRPSQLHDESPHPKRLSVTPLSGSHTLSRDPSRSPSTRPAIACDEDDTCYGSLLNLPSHIREDPYLSFNGRPPPSSDSDAIVLEHAFIRDTCWVRLRDGEVFGCVGSRLSRCIKRLEAFPCLALEFLVTSANLASARARWKKTAKPTELPININIYGHDHAAQTVGDTLAGLRLFLQLPLHDARSSVYKNPQYLQLPGLEHLTLESPAPIVLDGACKQPTEVSRSEIDDLLDHIPQPKFREVFVNCSTVTQLKRHQSEAVDFITRRETGDPSLSLWKPHVSPNGFFCFKHAITGAKSSETVEAAGGVLADDMGLGKTLSMLAAVVTSIPRAIKYAFSGTRMPTQHWQDVTPSRGTLVVVPSALLMDSWVEETERHFLNGTLLVHRYHGKGKGIDITHLLQHDIVLTTYASITADFCRGRSRLHRVKWYRVVLDEAHFIRNPSTKQFRAIHALPSEIRWCLTGTPIQNSLEDLGALAKFLKIPVLEDLASFRRQITTPVIAGTSGRFANLRRLLAAVCLRRTKALLNLPEPATDVRVLELSTSEATMYRDFGDLCKHNIDLAVSGHSFRKANQHVIQAILGMRLFCNDGEHALAKRMSTQSLPSDPDEALSYLQTSANSTCVLCGIDIITMYQEGDASSGRLTICQHLICGECIPGYKEDLGSSEENGRAECPVCGLRGKKTAFVVCPEQRTEDCATGTNSKFPTKLLALLENVKTQRVEDKCIVFSFWKTTLDIVARMFDSHGLPYCRIHGQIPANKRSKILTDYEKSKSVRILLITFGTGAVGLNKLKVANHIHILEPQWNPSVESQAIGRVLRMGQEKSVKITRYIMKSTVEEAVQSRQLRKLQLASGGFGFVKDEHNSNRVQEIMNLLCPTNKDPQVPATTTQMQSDS